MNTRTISREYGGLSFDKLRQVNVTRCENAWHKIDQWSPTDWACALAGEAGEACNLVKKLRRLDSEPSAHREQRSREELAALIGKELADIVIYADLLAARLRLDLGEEVGKKFNEVSARVGSEITL